MPLLPNSVTAAPGRAAAVAAGAAVVVAAGVVVVRWLRAPRIPADSEWRRVGRIVALDLFPMKSAKALPAQTLQCTDSGPCIGPLRDRSFVGIDSTGRFISGRSHPLLVLVQVTAQESADGRVLFELRSPKVEEVLTLDPTTFSKRTKKITVWHAPVSAVDCGEAAAVWLRKAVVVPSVHPEDSPNAKLRLVFFPFEHTDRAPIPLVPQHMRGIYTDETSYHLCTVSSVEELNKRLAKPVPARQFRPNFLVEGPPAFDEDSWSWVRIGSKAIFKVHMSCGRCAMTTIDPDTGVKSPEGEPLKTLRTFRKPTEKQKKMQGNDTPVLGMMLGAVRLGDVSVGDDVYAVPW